MCAHFGNILYKLALYGEFVRGKHLQYKSHKRYKDCLKDSLSKPPASEKSDFRNIVANFERRGINHTATKRSASKRETVEIEGIFNCEICDGVWSAKAGFIMPRHYVQLQFISKD